jgi:hypothetical protein
LALVEFMRRHRFALLEQFQRDDIAWALRHTGTKVPLSDVTIPVAWLSGEPAPLRGCPRSSAQ